MQFQGEEGIDYEEDISCIFTDYYRDYRYIRLWWFFIKFKLSVA